MRLLLRELLENAAEVGQTQRPDTEHGSSTAYAAVSTLSIFSFNTGALKGFTR
jgi:hypothetical protein